MTGFDKSIESSNMSSIYLLLRNRNLCNHRDYQNVAFNGATMKSLHEIQIPGADISRNRKPYLAAISFIGNDVCKKSLDEMTTPEEFGKDLRKSLDILEEISPRGSKVLVLGLVDG